MNKLGFVTINGKKGNTISVFDHGLLYGDGVYETIRVFNKKAFLFEDHIKRLFSSAKDISLKIPYSQKKLTNIIKTTFRSSKIDNAFIRIIITRGVGKQGLISTSRPNVIVIVSYRDFNPLNKVNLTISKIRKINESALSSKIKSLNYLNNILAKEDAIKRKFDDAILLNEKNMLTEATTSNLFIVKKGIISTPKSSSGILEGITRNAILKNFKIKERNLTVKDLLSADEVFLSGTVDFITRVKRINNKNYFKFEVSKIIFNKLKELAKNGTKFNIL